MEIKTELRKIFDKHECDKGEKHSYERCYEPDFEPIKNEKLNILEIGIDNGSSLKVWHEYFPNANIYGMDIFKRNKIEEVEILKEDRVHGIKLDSTKKFSKFEAMEAWPKIEFDIIIDDGLHTPEANKLTFENFFPLLKKEGYYYIEDVWALDKMDEKQLNHHWIKQHPNLYNYLLFDSFLKVISPYKIERYDYRDPESFNIYGIPRKADSYIIRVSK